MPEIESGGRRIVYDDYGAGPPLLMLHGSYANSAAWRGIGKLLEDRYRIVAPNLIGYGSTTGWADGEEPDIAREAELVEAVAGTLDAPPVLVGHSFGGNVVLATALRGNLDFAGMVLIEPVTEQLTRLVGEEDLHAEVVATGDRLFELLESSDEAGARYVIDHFGGQGAFDALPEPVRDYCIQTAQLNGINWKSTDRFEWELDALATIVVPALVIRAGNGLDWIACVCRTLDEHFADSRLVEVAGADHFIISTHTAEVAALIDGLEVES